jgi:hypothetical protein
LTSDVVAVGDIPDPARRLAAIEATRSLRLIRAIKATSIHRAWARRRYGAKGSPGS